MNNIIRYIVQMKINKNNPLPGLTVTRLARVYCTPVLLRAESSSVIRANFFTSTFTILHTKLDAYTLLQILVTSF
jgi:hypothetical protein